MLYWYHLYIINPGGDRLANKIHQVCHWKGLVTQAELFVKSHKIFRQFKKNEMWYGHLPLKIIAELTPWNLLQIDIEVPKNKSISA